MPRNSIRAASKAGGVGGRLESGQRVATQLVKLGKKFSQRHGEAKQVDTNDADQNACRLSLRFRACRQGLL